MDNSKGTVSDKEIVTGTKTSTAESILSVFGAYRWVALIIVVEAVLLALAAIADVVLGASLIGGLIASFAVVGAGVSIIALVGLVLYRVISSQ